MITFVHAGNHQQFLCYCDETKQKPSEELRYVSSGKDLLGQHRIKYVTYGTCYKRKDHYDIMALLRFAELP